MSVITNELHLPDVEIDSKEMIDGVLHYEVTLLEEEQHGCPVCPSSRISKNGHTSRTMADAPIYGTPVILHVRSQRYKCTKCGKVFSKRVSFADHKNKVTSRLKEQVEAYCLRSSVTELSEIYHVSVATISRITQKYIERLENSWQSYTPEILALVNISLGKSTRVLCVDVKRNGVVDLFEKADKASLITALQKRFDLRETDAVVIDFNRSHCNALKSVYRDVPIVIDKKYVLAKAVAAISAELRGAANHIVSLVLKNPASLSEAETEKLENALKADSHLQRIYKIKNLFFEMYKKDTSTDAENVFETIRHLVRKKDVYLFDLVQLIEEFFPEIFDFFDINYSFSAVQNAEKLVRKIEKKGAGFSYKNLRARLLFSAPPRQAVKTVPTNNPRVNNGNAFSFSTGFHGFQTATYESVVGNYADIDMLLECLGSE